MTRLPQRKPQTRLVLVTPPVWEPHEIAPVVAAACKAVDVAAVVVKLAPGSEAKLVMRIHALAPSIQSNGAALLLEGNTELVTRTSADGAHVAGIAALEAAMPRLKPDRIVGCSGLATRHDSMVAAERGADYVMFGEPDFRGRRPGFDAVRERVAWWAELFEIPCVGYAGALAEAEELAVAGADFVALADIIWNSAEGIGALIEANERLRTAEAAS